MNWDDYTAITTPADDDTFLEHDVSETVVGEKMKKITWANIKATLKAYFDTLYLAITAKAVGSDVDTGTNDAKYVTSKAISDSHNVPSVAPGTSGNVLTSNGTIWESAAPTGGGGGGSTPPGRLTLESGVPVSTTDQADKTTLYYTPMIGNQIMLYDGVSAWDTLTFAELSLNISAFTASKPYDIWAYNNAGTVTLDSTVWTNANTRATALAYQDGRLVKAGATTRLYLGTIYMDSASKCQDTTTKRLIWNYYNRCNRKVNVLEATNEWTYTTATWRSANNSTANRIESIIGVSEDNINISVSVSIYNGSACDRAIGIGLDKTNGNDATLKGWIYAAGGFLVTSTYNDLPGIGYHYFQWVEWSNATGTTTFYGDNANAAIYQCGMIGSIEG